MKAGDSVVLLEDPLLYGVGTVLYVLPNGALRVEWSRQDDLGERLQVSHRADALELLDRWAPMFDADRALGPDVGEGMGC